MTISQSILHIYKNESKTEKLHFVLILLIVFSLPFDIFYSSLISLTLIAVTLINFKKSLIKRIPKQVFIFQTVYFLSLVGYFYSYNTHEAGYLLERQLAILAFPLIIPLAVVINTQKTQLLMATLAFTSCVSVLYLLLNMLIAVSRLSIPWYESVFSGAFFNHEFSRPLLIHAGYLSLYVSLSIFFLVWYYKEEQSLIKKITIVAATLLLFTGLFFLASRNTIIATFLILLFVYPLFKVNNKTRYTIIAFLSLAFCLLLIKNVPYLKDRFSVELISDISPLKDGSYLNYNSVEPRVERWKVAMDLAMKSPLIGYGTGDEVSMLKTAYIKHRFYISYLENFNAHNQYISFLIKNGIPGLLIFLLSFYYLVKLALKIKHYLYLSFLVLLLIGFYTENILDANKGIVFFALFNTFLGYDALNTLQQSQAENRLA